MNRSSITRSTVRGIAITSTAAIIGLATAGLASADDSVTDTTAVVDTVPTDPAPAAPAPEVVADVVEPVAQEEAPVVAAASNEPVVENEDPAPAAPPVIEEVVTEPAAPAEDTPADQVVDTTTTVEEVIVDTTDPIVVDESNGSSDTETQTEDPGTQPTDPATPPVLGQPTPPAPPAPVEVFENKTITSTSYSCMANGLISVTAQGQGGFSGNVTATVSQTGFNGGSATSTADADGNVTVTVQLSSGSVREGAGNITLTLADSTGSASANLRYDCEEDVNTVLVSKAVSCDTTGVQSVTVVLSGTRKNEIVEGNLFDSLGAPIGYGRANTDADGNVTLTLTAGVVLDDDDNSVEGVRVPASSGTFVVGFGPSRQAVTGAFTCPSTPDEPGDGGGEVPGDGGGEHPGNGGDNGGNVPVTPVTPTTPVVPTTPTVPLAPQVDIVAPAIPPMTFVAYQHPANATPVAANDASLAYTGTDLGVMLPIGLITFTVGGVLLVATRKRSTN